MKVCPQSLSPELLAAINQVATLWHSAVDRPRIAASVLNGWDEALIQWVKDDSMPLIIRTTKAPPGSEVVHDSTRILIPSDNSPTQWAFTLAERGETPSLSQVRQYLQADNVPFAMAIKAANKPITRYFCNLDKIWDNPNKRGWKVGHIVPVGMKIRGDLAQFPIQSLRRHFLDLMSPRNMYAVPKAWAGLSEIEPINTFFRSHVASELETLHRRAGT
jgi:hypothetical protein